MNTTATPIHTCEPDEDFAICEVCDRTVFDDWTAYEEAGITVCGDCQAAEMREMERQCRGAYRMPTLAELREDQAGFTSDDREFWKLETLISRSY